MPAGAVTLTIVLDASVGLKLVLSEEHSEFAEVWVRRHSGGLRIPGHWYAECANALWAKVRLRRTLDEAVALNALQMLIEMPLLSVPVEVLLPSAVDLALRFERTVYDSLYLALALREQCPFVTADLRLYNALAPALPATVRWIAEP